MTVPTPAEIDASIRTMVEHLRTIKTEYRWVHGAAFSRAVADEAKVQVTSPNDPTGELATDRGRSLMRRQMYRASEAVEEALTELSRATGALRSAAPPDPGGIRFEALRNPRSASRADLAEARAAQERRELRGEAIP